MIIHTPTTLGTAAPELPVSILLLFNLKSGTLTRIADDTFAGKRKVPRPECTGVFHQSVFQRPALPGLGAADVRELSCNHSA